LPELPAVRRARFGSQYGLPDYDAGVLVADKAVADYFESAAALSSNQKAVSNWIMTEMLRLLSEKEKDIRDIPITPKALASLIKLVDSKTINNPTAKEIFAHLFENGGDPEALVIEKGLAQVSDSGAIEKLVEQAIAANPKSVADYRSGKKASAKFLVGQVMKMSKGKADPEMVGRMIEKKLDSPA
jgi:aspartyl-tRNA(Asn)/glutamyl-tRNA(Gln) amidotransferase subunit B